MGDAQPTLFYERAALPAGESGSDSVHTSTNLTKAVCEFPVSLLQGSSVWSSRRHLEESPSGREASVTKTKATALLPHRTDHAAHP